MWWRLRGSGSMRAAFVSCMCSRVSVCSSGLAAGHPGSFVASMVQTASGGPSGTLGGVRRELGRSNGSVVHHGGSMVGSIWSMYGSGGANCGVGTGGAAGVGGVVGGGSGGSGALVALGVCVALLFIAPPRSWPLSARRCSVDGGVVCCCCCSVSAVALSVPGRLEERCGPLGSGFRLGCWWLSA